MKKVIFLVLMLCFVVGFTAEASWKNCEFPQILKFKYPDTIELKKGSYEAMTEKLQNYKQGERANLQLRFIPSNPNDKTCRVSVLSLLGREKASDFSEPMHVNQKQLIEFQDFALQKAYKDLNVQVDLVNPAEVFSFDNKQCIYMEYHYDLPNEPKWYAYIYNFNDNGRRYRVVIHVRSDKYKQWIESSKDIRNIVRTLQPIW